MPRDSSCPELVRVNISLDRQVHLAGRGRAKREGIKGGFSEYLSRLVVADMSRKNSIAPRFGYLLPKKEAP